MYETLRRVYSYPATDKSKYKIALVFRDADFFLSSSAFIRLISPLSDKSLKNKVSFKIFSAQNLPAAIDADFTIVQRTAFDHLPEAKEFIQKTRERKAKVIVDNDDAFHEISESHPEYHEQIERVEAMEYLLKEAVQLWLSEKSLVPSQHKEKSIVVRNSLDKRLWTANTGRKPPTRKIQMVYMGTATHDADLEMILPALDSLHKKHPGSFRLTVIGISSDLPRRKWMRQLFAPKYGSIYPNFVRWFVRKGPFDIGLSPLVDNKFNRAKSDIKCLDYLAAGIVPVVSDILPYWGEEIQEFIVKIKNDKNAWVDGLSRIVSAPDKFRKDKAKIIPEAQKYIWQKRSSAKTAKTLFKHLEELKSK